ncbi:MAG TPA: M20 family metallopeptidase [Candidatus Dormibacteraeota bacterium]|nr:M20 family metallopeptidase [Candidatus Dormibacteraeota bacterium]
MNHLLEFLCGHRDDMVVELRSFVEHETPSTDKARLDAFASLIAHRAEQLTGGRARVIEQEAAGGHVHVQVGDGDRPVVLLGHYDTVWPLGTLERMPFRVKDGVARGPGAFDMKAGLVQALWALHALREAGGRLPPVALLVNSDEELGSPTSRALIETEARRAAAVLVLEPSQAGAVKTARKGVGLFNIEVTGRAAHAGADPLAGISAIDELARLVLAIRAQTNGGNGTTMNVGVIRGGTRANVVAAHASAEVDLRVVTSAEAERVSAAILELRPHHPGAVVRITGGLNRPPMERTAQIAELFEHARGLAAEIGFPLDEAMTGGGSDGNFAAAVGAPVLDGLGAVGGGAHALTEHVLVEHMPPRAALLARLIETLG